MWVMHHMYTLCYICHKLWCKAQGCKSPDCYKTCIQYVNGHNTVFDFCGRCKHDMTQDFEQQMATKQLKGGS